MYENITYETILQRMLERVSDKMDKREGSVIWDTHSPTAIELQILYLEIDNILQEAFGDTASREYLILRCKDRGITPESATNAVLRGIFTPATIDVLGKRFNIGSLNYTVAEKKADGEYLVMCETPGIIGNQYLGRMLPIEYIDGLETAELVEVSIPGKDEEDTETLRERYMKSFDKKAFGGNVEDYLTKVKVLPGVGSVKVKSVWNGDIHPSELIPTGEVRSWYSDIKSTLSEGVSEWLSAVYQAADEKKLTTGGTVLLTILDSEYNAASGELLQTTQTEVDPEENAGEGYGMAPIGHVVTIRSADSVLINVSTEIVFDEGYSWDNLQNSIESAVNGYLLELRKEWEDSPYLIVRLSQIETRLLSIPGIIDISNTKINGEEMNLTLGEYEIPVFGSIKGGEDA